MIGELIGNFRIMSALGEGGMGEVFLAEQQQIHTKVAIKMLLAKISENHEIVQRFFNEAIAVSKIQHSGIARIFDVGFHPATGRAYLVMEFLEGETLSARIKRGPMSVAEIADIGRQASSILDAVHKAGITHRDLKPDNIFLVPDAELPRGERVKILDFGIAKLGGAGVGMTSTNASAMGTPLYMSPEQWMSSGKVDWRADAYSLGCVLFEMITGRAPFSGESIGQLCAHHLSSPPPHPSELVAVPAALDALVVRLLAKAPEDRPGSMREIGTVFTTLDGAAPSSAYSAPLSAPYSAAMAAAGTSAAGKSGPGTAPAIPSAMGAGAALGTAATIAPMGGGSTTLGAAASSVDVPAARKSRALPIIGGVVLAAAMGVGVFAALHKTPASPAKTPPKVAAGAPTPPPAPAAPPDAAPVEIDAAQVAAAPVDAAQVAAVEPPPHEDKPKPVDKKPPVIPTKKPTKPVEPTKPVTPPPPPPPDPNLPEKIDRPMIKAMISKLKGQLEVCRAKRPDGGAVLVQVQVKPDGSLGDIVFLKTPDVEASKCVLAKMQEVAKFPATKNGGQWKAQFELPGKYVPGQVEEGAGDAPVKKPKRKY